MDKLDPESLGSTVELVGFSVRNLLVKSTPIVRNIQGLAP